jgi:uncharacterized protein YfaS (alpha-2-macroglobulin family)
MPLDRQVWLTIRNGLRGAEGPLAMYEVRWSFRTYGPMGLDDFTACDNHDRCPYGPLVILTSNKAQVETLRSRLSIEPKVDIDWGRVEAHEDAAGGVRPPWIVVPGKFRPGTHYQVRVAAGVKDVFGQEAAEASGSFWTSDLDPRFDIGGGTALLEAAGDGALPVETVNLTRLEAKVWRLEPADVARMGDYYQERSADPPGAPARLTLDVSGSRNAVRTQPLALPPLLGGKRTGLFLAEVSAPELSEPHRTPQRVLGQITDLAVHAKLGATSGAAWVTRLSDGRPVSGADLALHDGQGQVRWQGRTDGDGLAAVPGLAVLGIKSRTSWQTPFALLAASKDGDTGVTLSSWSDALGPHSFDLPTDWDGKEPKSLGAVFAERGIYRPGETVHLKAVVRFRRLGKIVTPDAGSKLKLAVTSSRGKEVLAREVTTTAFGTFGAQFDLGADVPLGTYWIAASGTLGSGPVSYGGAFRVEEYRPPQFKVDVDAPARELVAGDALGARVLARYLFGGAMAGADVRWSVNRATVEFEPPGNPGFAFGIHSWWWDDDAPSRSSDVFGAGEGTTDALGSVAVEAGKAEAPGGRTWEYTVEAEVSDVNRQRLANRAVLTVHPASWYAGLRRRTAGFAEAGRPVVLEAVAVSPAGARQERVPLALAVKRREWKSIRKKGVGDRWTTLSEVVEETVHTCRLESAKAPAACAFTPDRPGMYVAEAVATDEGRRQQTTRLPFYVLGPGWVSWQRNDTDRLDLVADKALYDVGETAKVLVKSPYPEAEAILTVEREGVLSARRVRLTGAATALEVPLDDESVPNVFVSVLLVRGRVPEEGAATVQDDPARPAVRIGYTQLKVERRSKRLDVALAPDRAEKRPRDKVRVDVQVKDWRGKGTPAEVAVWAVDEGVLRLTGYQVPDPVEMIHPPRGLSVRIGEPLIHLVLRRLYGEKGFAEGGGGGGDGSGSGFRSRFKTTVLFAPEVITDEDGRAQVEFDLPDNLTTYRIMAVAVTRGDRVGRGQSHVTVAKPLLALPALPRLARVGDRFEAGVVVHAPGAKVREVEVRAEATGLALEGPAVRSIALDGGKPREVRFRFRAEAPGEAVLRFALQGGGERDGVEQRIPVQLPVGVEAVAVYGEARDVRREGFVPPGGTRGDVGGLEVSLASTALGGFSEGMRQLIDYPYGCLEQLSSRLVPFVALRELQGKFGLAHGPASAGQRHEGDPFSEWFGTDDFSIHATQDPDEVVRRTVKTIEQLQNHDGGYRYWASSGCSGEWASAYAVLSLGRAAEVGYPVDRAALARGQAYLADTVAAGKCTRCSWGCRPPTDTTRTFALYALARTRAPRASYYGELFGRRQKLPLFAQAMLADAMFVGGGDRAQARQVLSELMNHAKESPAEVHFEEADARTYAATWSSDARTTAIVLQTLADVAPDHPYAGKIAAYLTKARRPDGRFRNTQESAFALMALTELVRTKERDVPDFTARVTLGGAALAEVPFHGRSMSIARRQVPMSKLPTSGKELPFEFQRDGKEGVLYYGALLRYAPAVLPLDPLDRGLVVQRWFEPYQGGGQVRAVRAGELVRIRVRVASHMERSFVAVEVPLPSGLEAVDTTLASTAGLERDRGEEGRRVGYGYESDEDLDADGGMEEVEGAAWAHAFWSPFNHVEQRDDRVVLFADRLPPGVHVASFVARATTPGDFLLKPARAEEMYTPEVFGRSDGGKFEVVEVQPIAER